MTHKRITMARNLQEKAETNKESHEKCNYSIYQNQSVRLSQFLS